MTDKVGGLMGIRAYIDRAKQAQGEHDQRPGTQLAFADNHLFTPQEEGSGVCGICHPNHDEDPGDCTDHRGV